MSMESSRPGNLITSKNLVQHLCAAVPEFKPDSDDVGLLYAVANRLIDYAVALSLEKDRVQIASVFRALEEAAEGGDPAVTDIVRDALWGLATWHNAEIYRPFMGHHSRQLLRQALL